MHQTISSSVAPFSSCPQFFLASRYFPMSQLFTSGGQTICSFSFNISPSSEHPGLISFRMNWLDLLAVQGTLKSFLQHHSSKASTLQCSAFFIVQLSHPYTTTGKTIDLTRQTFVGHPSNQFWNFMRQMFWEMPRVHLLAKTGPPSYTGNHHPSTVRIQTPGSCSS